VQVNLKRNVSAFVLIPPDARQAIDILIENRRKVGVPSTNVYIFGRLSADSPMAGHTEMTELAMQCKGLKFPERITSRQLRTYIATVSQVSLPVLMSNTIFIDVIYLTVVLK